MERVPEPELMLEEDQARAYAEADFSASHSRFVTLFQEMFEDAEIRGPVLDLGCGAADITLRFARAFPDCEVHGVDGSEAMLRFGHEAVERAPDVRDRVRLFQGFLPGVELPRERYSAIISNSLLHHLPDPQVLWNEIRRLAAPGAPVFVMDLRRPASLEEVRRLREEHAAGAPEVLARDFYCSLLAAFEVGEIEDQLSAAGLGDFEVREVGELHLIAGGRVAAGLV